MENIKNITNIYTFNNKTSKPKRNWIKILIKLFLLLFLIKIVYGITVSTIKNSPYGFYDKSVKKTLSEKLGKYEVTYNKGNKCISFDNTCFFPQKYNYINVIYRDFYGNQRSFEYSGDHLDSILIDESEKIVLEELKKH